MEWGLAEENFFLLYYFNPCVKLVVSLLVAQTICHVFGLFALSHFASIQNSSKMRRMSKKFVPQNLPCDFSHTWVCAIVSKTNFN